MKKQFQILGTLLLLTIGCYAQHDSSYPWPKKLPKYKIHLETAEGNKITGLLVAKDDSSVVIYPGKFNSYENKKQYMAAIYTAEQIEQIKVHNRKSAGRGALIGLGIGMLPLVATIFAGKDAQSFAMVSFVTIPVGTLVGAVIGSTASKTFHIGRQRDNYRKFSGAIKL